MKLKEIISKKSKAQAIVEFAIVLPVLLLLLYGILEAGRLIFMYSIIVNDSRQAVRYAATTGVGNGTGNANEYRYQDCDGIRSTAKNISFLNPLADSNIVLKWDTGPNTTQTTYCAGSATTDSVTFSGNTNRVEVTISKQFTPLVTLVPFTIKAISSTSRRTVLISVPIAIATPIGLTATTTTITADTPDPSIVGQSVNVTVTVTGGTSPTGTVAISGADTNCVITLAAGTGNCNVVFNSGGSKLLNATYSGDSSHAASYDSTGEIHTVYYSTVTTITSDNPDPSLANQAITVNVTVTNGSATPPTGTVAISGANTNCTITLVNGSGSCNTVNFTSNGAKTITATYSGDSLNITSNTNISHTVLASNGTATQIISHTPNPSVINTSVAVSVVVQGITTPTGTVSITGADTNCTITLASGAGSCNVSFTTVGAKTITATYNPDASHTTSSTSIAHTVSLPPSVTTITSDTPDPSTIGQSVAVTVTVTGASTVPTGTVSITGADTNCTITLAAGTGTCNVVFNTSGSKNIVATYNGNASYATSTANQAHTVLVAVPTAVPSCNTITHGAVIISGNTMSMTIKNPYAFPLTTDAGSVTWNDDKGHQLGADKSLSLQSVTIGATTVWTGNSSLVSTMPWTTPATIAANTTVTITFNFQQSYDNLDGTESIYITLSTPGCESNPIQTQ